MAGVAIRDWPDSLQEQNAFVRTQREFKTEPTVPFKGKRSSLIFFKSGAIRDADRFKAFAIFEKH